MLLKIKIISIIIFSLTLLSVSPLTSRGDSSADARRDFRRSFTEKFPEIKTVGLLAPIIEIAKLKGFDKAKRLEKRARQSAWIFERVLSSGLDGLPFKIKPIRPDKESREEIKEIRVLYMAVSHTLNTYVFNGNRALMTLKNNKFDYSLGSVKHILEKYQVDGLLLAKGFDQLSAGLKAVEYTSVSALSGVVDIGFFMAKYYHSTLDMAIVDGTGDILWYVSGETKAGKFNNPDSVRDFLAETFRQTPLNEKWEADKAESSYREVDYNNPRGHKK